MQFRDPIDFKSKFHPQRQDTCALARLRLSGRCFFLFLIITSLFPTIGLFGCTRLSGIGVLIDYRRSGGIAGIDDQLAIDANGKATLTRQTGRYEFSVDAGTMKQLLSNLDNAGFVNLGSEYMPSRQGNDTITYRVTYKGHTVQMADTAVPESLQPVLDQLNRIVDTKS